jgi:hypothetical protein
MYINSRQHLSAWDLKRFEKSRLYLSTDIPAQALALSLAEIL